jgi:hypothetical protein
MTQKEAIDYIAETTLKPDTYVYKHKYFLADLVSNNYYYCEVQHVAVGENWYKYQVPVIGMPSSALTWSVVVE